MVKISTESMNAVTGSKLGSDMEALWQEVIDYRDKNLSNMSFDNKVKALETFFSKKIGKRFMDLVWKHTGLNIEAIFFKPHFETQFCTWMCYGKSDELTDAGTQQLEGILNAQANSLVNDWLSTHEFSVDDLMAIAKSFDVQRGIIKPEYRAKMKKWIRCAMGFDLSLGFLCKDYLPKNAGVEYLTARELTAIMLHEIGHNLTMVEHAADMYAHTSAFNAMRDVFTKHATPQKAIELGKRVSEYAIKNGFVKDGQNFARAVQQAEKDVAAAGKHIHKEGSHGFIFSMIGSAFVLLADAVTRTMDVLVCDPTRMSYRGRSNQTKKLSDTVVNDRMLTWQERKADEFAMTHGYGADQVDALDKITRFYMLLGRSEEDIREVEAAERGNKNLSLFTRLSLSYYAHLVMGIPQYRLYPPGAERYREILQLTIKNLKIHGASAEYVSKYTADIERMINTIDKMSREEKYVDEQYQRYKMFLKFCSVRSFVNWLTNGNIEHDIAECIENIQKLNNNLITYFGYKFDQLAKR